MQLVKGRTHFWQMLCKIAEFFNAIINEGLKICVVKNLNTNECLTASRRSCLLPRLSVIIINDAHFNKSSLLLLRRDNQEGSLWNCNPVIIIKESARNNNENNKIGHVYADYM